MESLAPNPLAERLRRRIENEGPRRFSEFMATALYDPELGYYGSGQAQIGRRGDFMTSVSVGPLFGRLLAWQFAEMWAHLGQPGRFTLAEQGAHDGTLARDILGALQAAGGALWEAVEYIIVEPSPVWQERQARHLEEFKKVRWAKRIEGLEGVFFANELVDALPVERVLWNGAEWRLRRVGWADNEFCWQTAEIAPAEWTSTLPQGLPAAYETEVRPSAAEWMRTTASALRQGWLLVIDYGYERAEFYLRERTRGTLSGYAKHERIKDVLADPGQVDLTAHVEFTQLLEGASAEGMRLAGFTDQHRFCGALGASYFAAHGASAKELRAFKTLMHPGLMGAAFKVACWARGEPADRLLGFSGTGTVLSYR